MCESIFGTKTYAENLEIKRSPTSNEYIQAEIIQVHYLNPPYVTVTTEDTEETIPTTEVFSSSESVETTTGETNDTFTNSTYTNSTFTNNTFTNEETTSDDFSTSQTTEGIIIIT
jgi:hypothetical protein